MPDETRSDISSRIARHQLAVAFVLAGIITNTADVWITLQARALESNPIVLDLGWGPWVAVKAGALLALVGAWWIGRKHRLATAAAAGPFVVGLGGLIGNASALGWYLTATGRGASIAIVASALVVSAGVVGIDRLRRGVAAGRSTASTTATTLRPVTRRAGPAVVALLVVTSTFGGLALLGTQPLADGQSGTASAAAGDEEWNVSTGGTISTSPTIVDGTVYFTSEDGNLYAADQETGDINWTFSANGLIETSPTVANRTVFFGSDDGNVYAVDADTGAEKWSYDSGSAVTASPTVSNGTVFAGNDGGTVFALDESTGDLKWNTGGYSNTPSAPTVVNETAYYGFGSNGNVLGFDTETGNQDRDIFGSETITSAVTYKNGTLFIPYATGVKAVNESTLSQIWDFSTSNDATTPTVSNGSVYFGTLGNNIYAVDESTGSEKWSYTAGSSVYSDPTVANGVVYAGSNDNNLYAIDAVNGGLKWDYTAQDLVHSPPTVADGTAFFGDWAGNFYAVETSHSEDSSGSRNELHTLGHVGGVYQSTGGTSSTPDLNGTAINQRGQPCVNCTITVTGIDRAPIDGNPAEINETINEIEEQITNPEPPNWTADRQLTGGDGLFGNADTMYVAAHEKSDWGLTAYTDTPQLGNPSVQLPANEQVALSVWDPTDTGLLQQNAINRDLPGSVVDDTDIVIESIDHAGGTVDTRTVETDTTYDTNFLGSDTIVGGEFDLATVTLPAGFYRVYPEGSPETSYVIVVGDPDEIVASIEEDLRNEKGRLSEQAQRIRDYMDRDVLKQYETTTDANGSWSVNVPDSVTRVSVQAHKAPPGLDQDPRNASLQDVREFYAVTEYNGSYVMPADAGTYSVPQHNIRVEVVEAEAPQFADLGKYQNATEQLRNFLQNFSYSDLPQGLQQQLEELSRGNAEEMAQKLQRLTNQNSRLETRVEELMNRDLSDIEINDSSDEQLREQIQAQQQAIAELRSTIETLNTDTEVDGDVATSTATFAQQLTEDNIRVVANFPNGTSREVPSEYITLDQSAGTLVGQGGTDVMVEDYPLGGAESVTFDYVVVTEDGIGETTTRAGTSSIGLDAISLSSLRPGPDEQVDVTLVGDDETQVTNITAVRAVAPDGTELDATTDGPRTATFTTNGQGRHYIEVTFETASGATGTLTHRIKAGANDQAMPAGIRLKDSVFGTLAVVGDGLQSGSVDVQQGGSVVDVTVDVGADNDAPAKVHLYAHGLSMPPQATLNVEVLRDGQALDAGADRTGRNVEITAHLPRLTSDTPTLYRNDNALPREGDGRIGSVQNQPDETTITTVTSVDGTVSIETNNNPGAIERGLWYVDRISPSFNIPLIGTIFAPVPMPVEIGTLAWSMPAATPAASVSTPTAPTA